MSTDITGWSAAEFETLSVEHSDDILTIVLDRPAKLNALSTRMLLELRALALRLRHGAGVRGVILTGAGDRAFVAGADIAEMARMGADDGESFAALGQEVTTLLEALPMPVVAAVNGYALGGGCELAMACDIIYATRSAAFGQPEVTLGLIPGFGGCVRLQRLVGPGWAKELLYTGRRITAETAERIGLVTRVFPSKAAMLAAAVETLEVASVNSPVAIGICKEAVNAVHGQSTADGLRTERRAFRRAFSTEDMREGMTAFITRRKATFPGR